MSEPEFIDPTLTRKSAVPQFTLDPRQRARLEAIRLVRQAIAQGHPTAISIASEWIPKLSQWLYAMSHAELDVKINCLSMAAGPLETVDVLIKRADGLFRYVLSDGAEKLQPFSGAPTIGLVRHGGMRQ